MKLGYRRRLRILQKQRADIVQKSEAELKGLTGERLSEVRAQWSAEYFMTQDEIEALQSDHIRSLAERYDIALPKSEVGEFWNDYFGGRLILTVRGREFARAKIREEQKSRRETWGFYLNVFITIGSLAVAALAIIFR